MALNHKGKIHKAETGLRFIDIFIVHYRELHSGYDRLHIPFQSKKAATSPSTFRQATVLTASYQFRPSDGVRCVLLRLAKIIPEVIGITQLVHPLHLPLHQLPTTSHRNDQQLGYPYIPQIITNEVLEAR